MLAERFPLIREVRRAAGAARAIRLTLAVASLASAARVEMSAAPLAAQALSDDSAPRRRGAITAAVAGGGVSRSAMLRTPSGWVSLSIVLRTPSDRVSPSTMLRTPSDRVSRLSKGWAPESLGANRWKWARKGPLRG